MDDLEFIEWFENHINEAKEGFKKNPGDPFRTEDIMEILEKFKQLNSPEKANALLYFYGRILRLEARDE